MKDVDLQNLFDTKAIIGRFYRKRFGKVIGFAKVLIPIDGVDQALSQDFSLSGSKLRVAGGINRYSRPRQCSRLLRLPHVELAVGIEVVKCQVRLLHL